MVPLNGAGAPTQEYDMLKRLLEATSGKKTQTGQCLAATQGVRTLNETGGR